MIAVSIGDQEITKMLIEAGADLNLEDSKGWNALAYEVEAGNREAIVTLLEAGIENYVSAQRLAEESGQRDIIETIGHSLINRQHREIVLVEEELKSNYIAQKIHSRFHPQDSYTQDLYQPLSNPGLRGKVSENFKIIILLANINLIAIHI